MRRRNGSRWASYIALRPAARQVIGTFVSRPCDVKYDACRLYGPDAGWVSWSAATADLKRLAKRADEAGLPVAMPLKVEPPKTEPDPCP